MNYFSPLFSKKAHYYFWCGLLLSAAFLRCDVASASFAASSPQRGGGGLPNNLSVTELKRLLTERGIDFRDCLEKSDLIDRLVNSLPQQNRYNNAPPLELTADENRLISTFKRVSPSVALITIHRPQAPPLPFSLGMEENNIPAGAGSGFLWDDLGHVVTNCHVVVADTGVIPNRVKVKLQGMAEACDAKVVGVEPEKDLAVLKIPPHNLPTPVAVGTSNDLQVGQKVYAIGNPFGLQSSLTTGVVSAIGRDVQGFGGRQIKGCIQTDAAINPGNSGGPLLDSRGRIIGVNTMIYSPNAVNGIGGNVGIGFAIPVDTVRRVVNEIIRYGRVVRPTLGINVADDRVLRSIEAQLRRPMEGVLVAEVIPNSPAERAGLQASQLRGDGSINLGDLITDVDGQPIREVEDLLSAIEEKREGDIVELGIQRFCDPYQQERVSVQLVSRESLQGGFRPAMSAGRNGRPVGRPPWERPPWQ